MWNVCVGVSSGRQVVRRRSRGVLSRNYRSASSEIESLCYSGHGLFTSTDINKLTINPSRLLYQETRLRVCCPRAWDHQQQQQQQDTCGCPGDEQVGAWTHLVDVYLSRGGGVALAQDAGINSGRDYISTDGVISALVTV